ncbi:MAG: Smr/MutS family protein [Alkalispirochaeta sp.]
MNSVRALEFDRIRTAVAEQAVSEEGASELRALVPLTDRDVLGGQQAVVSWLQRRLQEGDTLPGGAVPPIQPILAAVEREGSILELEDLRDLRLFLEFAREVVQFFKPRREESPPPAVTAVTAGADLPEELLRRLREIVLPEGTINEAAIPELARLRKEIRRLNQGLLETAEQMIRRDRHMFQGDQPTIRDGRTVVPLAANFRGRIDGIVHESSGSGETVYVEPRELVDLNNNLVQAQNGILREIRRILRELSEHVRNALPTMRELHGIVVAADQLVARAKYAGAGGGRIIPAGNRIMLHGARHPLLGSGAVPLDIVYGEDTRIMIISGPNTGGKTVLLKAVGLLSMMNQSAIPIPVAEDSVIPHFDYWGVDIGDAQSLDEALSTFSGHLRNLAEVCDHAGAGSLILLDELGSGTDPDEGAALSMAIVDHLIDQGSTVLVTTHQTVLKHYGYTREGAANASMAFDEETHEPTYRVVPGRPGASHALDTAERQGLNRDILRRAREYLSDRESSVAVIITRLSELEEEMAEEREMLRRDRETLDRRLAELTRREEAVDARATELRRNGLVELDRLLRDARRQVEGEVRRLRERGSDISRAEIKAAQDQLQDIESSRDAQQELVDRYRDRETAPAETEPIREGDTIRHRRTNRDGTVRSIRNGGAEVQFGGVRMTVPLEDLERRSASDGSRGNSPDSPPEPPRSRPSTPQMRSVFELDLRGKRLHTAIEELERQVDAAVLNDLTSFSVIHGMGTGVLQKGVRDYLESRPEVDRYEFAAAEDGGFGKTLVFLA